MIELDDKIYLRGGYENPEIILKNGIIMNNQYGQLIRIETKEVRGNLETTSWLKLERDFINLLSGVAVNKIIGIDKIVIEISKLYFGLIFIPKIIVELGGINKIVLDIYFLEENFFENNPAEVIMEISYKLEKSMDREVDYDIITGLSVSLLSTDFICEAIKEIMDNINFCIESKRM